MHIQQFLKKIFLVWVFFLLSGQIEGQTITTITACDSYTWPSNGQTYTVTAVDAHYVNSITVDSLYLTIVNSTTSSFTQHICANESYTWNGVSQTVAGNYADTFATSFGCDSIVTLNLVVNPTPMLIISSSNEGGTCEGAAVELYGYGCSSYTWNGNTLNGSDTTMAPAVANTYTIVGTDANGCTKSTTFDVVVNAVTQELALATTNNLASIVGEDYMYQTQPDGTSLLYFDSGCSLIAKITDSLGATTLGFTMAMVIVDADVNTFNNQPYLRRHYYIEPENQGAANITLYLTQEDFNNYNANNGTWLDLPTGPSDVLGISYVRITKVNGGDLGIVTPEVITPTLSWNSVKNYWEVSFHVNGFSHFYFHSLNPANSPLPIQLYSFNGIKESSSNLITWTTSQEQNNAYFVLQRSQDALHFGSLAKVESKAKNGNSSSVLKYHFEDKQPSYGHNYYRVLQVDIDGKMSLSEIIDIFWTNDFSTSIYPNPAKDLLNIEFNSDNDSPTSIQLIDFAGKLIKQVEMQAHKGSNKITMNLDDLSLGFYLVEIYNDNIMKGMYKVVKEQ